MKSEPAGSHEKWLHLLYLLGAVTLVWLAFGLIIYSGFRSKVTATGPFGDTFGILNALFSGLAFAALIYTVLLQRKELELQRKELELTRAELKGQKEQLEQQNRTFAQQRFESTFFQMVDLHHSIVAAIETPSPSNNQPVRGRTALNELGEFFRRITNVNNFGDNQEARLRGAIDFYLANYHDRQHVLAHYFRNLYRIMKLVHDSEMRDKTVYSGIVRAQLSNSELVLLFFNCLSPLGCEKFKPLAEKYSLFEHIPKDEAFLTKYRHAYDGNAFGKEADEEALPLPGSV